VPLGSAKAFLTMDKTINRLLNHNKLFFISTDPSNFLRFVNS
jgi:hypothetical protein